MADVRTTTIPEANTAPEAPPSPTHGWVVALSLWVSGRDVPYTREDLLQRLPPAATALPGDPS